MTPVSEREYEAALANVLPEPAPVADGVWVVPLALPTGTVPYTLTYLIRDAGGGIHVIDPGFDTDGNWWSLMSMLTSIGSRPADIASIIVTHLHPDHFGMATRLRAATSAPILLHRRENEALTALIAAAPHLTDIQSRLSEEWGVPADRRPELEASARTPTTFTGTGTGAGIPAADRIADVLLGDGELLPVPGRRIEVILTSGHTPGHICLRDPDARLLFSGDHVLPMVVGGLGLGGRTPENPIRACLASLDAVRPYDDHVVLPGHGYRFTGLRERCDAIEAHHRRRSADVAAVIAELGDPTIWQIAERVRWSPGWANMRDFLLVSALAQTAMHVDFLATEPAAA
jgi:glyoxylase-like metal-dependent hydrolase (beta-lactamase superfamily II)